MVARRDEVAAVREFLDGMSGAARALAVDGEAGLGKSTLFRAVVHEASERGYLVLRCSGAEAEARLSFLGLCDMLGDVVDGCTESLSGVQREALDRATGRTDVTASPEPDTKIVGLALRAVLIELAERSPVLLAIDDAGWIDASTAAVVAFVARRLDDHAVGFLATTRTPTVRLDPLALELALGSDRARRISLGPLDRDAIIEIVGQRLPGRFAPPELRRIADASGGNPLFAIDIARSFDHSARPDPGAPLVVPATLHALVSGRIDALSPAAKTALLAAASLFRPTEPIVVSATSVAGLAESEESQLVRIEGGRVVFTHPLYAAAAYRAAATARRRAMHRRLAGLVADPEERARHRALGSTGPSESVAAELAEAASRTHARGATDSAAEMAEQAFGLTPVHHPSRRCRRGVVAAELHAEAGDLRRARDIVDAVLALSPDDETLDRALSLLAELVYSSESGGVAAVVLRDIAESAHDRSVAAWARLRLAIVRGQLGDLAAAREHADLGLALATEAADAGEGSGALAYALAVSASVASALGAGIDVDVLARACAIEDQGPPLPLSLSPKVVSAAMLMTAGEFVQVRGLVGPIVDAEMQGTGDGIHGPRILAFMAWMEAHAGNPDVASAYLREAERRIFAPGNELNRAQVLMHSVLVRGLRGDVERARSDADEALSIAHEHHFARPIRWTVTARAMLENSLGNPAGAWSAVEELVPAVEASGLGDPGAFHFVPEAIHALVGLGDLDRAERLLTMWERRARELDRAWALASGARCRAALATARRDWPRADEAVATALAELERVELPIELGRTYLVEGQLRRRRREKLTARRALESAADIFERSGAVLWRQRAEDELERVGSGRRVGQLSATESQVAALVAAGKTNRQVAAELFISAPTVKANLGRVFRTLGVQSRSELAARWPSHSGAHP